MGKLALIAPGIYSSLSKEELRDFFFTADLVITDLDGCIFPGVTKMGVYHRVCLLLLQSGKLKNFLLLTKLLLGMTAVLVMKLVQLMHLGITNRQLILLFSNIMKGVPLAYMKQAAKLIPPSSYPGVKESIVLLSRKAKLGIISQGLDLVLKEYTTQFKDNHSSFLDFWDGNKWEDLLNYSLLSKKGHFIFGSYDKTRAIKRRIKEFAARKIIVIGHNNDDLGMMQVARQYSGLIIGFNPTRSVKNIAQLIIQGKDWREFSLLLHSFLG